MLDSALVIVILHNLLRLHVSQCAYCGKTILYIKRVFSTK